MDKQIQILVDIETKWSQIKMKTEKSYLYRDSQSCDHYIMLKNRLYGFCEESFEIKKVFECRYKRRDCECCEDKAEWVVVNS